MTYAPAIPQSGYAGWAFLKRTMPAQTTAFNKSSALQADEAYFRNNIAQVTTAADLVSDRRLLKIALGAFGLDRDINNSFFIQKVLSDGTLKAGTLANKLADKQYQKFSAAFGFGDFSVPSTKVSTFPDKILTAYKTRQFEIAVGDQSPELRLALNLQRELPLIAERTTSEASKWFTIMGNAPLRTVFEKALGLPSNIGALDIDKQLQSFQSKANSQFGSNTIAQFTDMVNVDKLIRRYLGRTEVEKFAQANGGNAAVVLMQNAVSNARYRAR